MMIFFMAIINCLTYSGTTPNFFQNYLYNSAASRCWHLISSANHCGDSTLMSGPLEKKRCIEVWRRPQGEFEVGVILLGGHFLSGETKDYTVEPYKFTKEFADIVAYDTKDDINKLFKISRMGDVRVLGDWEHEDAHQEQPIDAFRMSGKPMEHVKLRLTLRAKNLLSEEFPITGEEVYPVKRNW